MKRHRLKKFGLWILLFGWMAIIFLFSNQSGTVSEDVSSGVLTFFTNLLPFELSSYLIRKVAHFMEYMILGMLLILLFYEYHKISKKDLLLCLLLCILYACSDEFHQIFISGRTPKVFDVMIDTIGSFTGISFVYLIHSNILK